MEDKIFEGLAYAIPAIVTGAVAYMILSRFIETNNKEKQIDTIIAKKKESLPIKLQAYERLVLFCERLNPMKLVVRVTPIGDDVNAYLHLLLGSIEQEFEHNMVQQLYVSDECWKAVLASKLAIVGTITELAEKAKNAMELQNSILEAYGKKESPTETTVAYIKQDVRKLL